MVLWRKGGEGRGAEPRRGQGFRGDSGEGAHGHTRAWRSGGRRFAPPSVATQSRRWCDNELIARAPWSSFFIAQNKEPSHWGCQGITQTREDDQI